MMLYTKQKRAAKYGKTLVRFHKQERDPNGSRDSEGKRKEKGWLVTQAVALPVSVRNEVPGWGWCGGEQRCFGCHTLAATLWGCAHFRTCEPSGKRGRVANCQFPRHFHFNGGRRNCSLMLLSSLLSWTDRTWPFRYSPKLVIMELNVKVNLGLFN